MSDRLELQMQNRLSELERVMEAATGHLERHGAGAAAVYAANLALEELITNVIKYGYDDGSDAHWIAVRLGIEGGRFHLEVSDDGHPFNPFDRAAPDLSLPLEERGIGGLGIHVVRNLLDRCHYERRDGRNIVSVEKALAPREA